MWNDCISRIAPHLIVGLAGAVLGGDERRLLAGNPPAGIILFDRNIESLPQTVRLVDEARRAAAGPGAAPLIVCADHEGGAISVLARAIGAPPSPAAVWRPRDEALLASCVGETARRIAACGVDLVLAPLADIDIDPDNPVIGTRAFAGTAAETAAAVRAAVKAYAQEGLLTCLKHFPGHGATKADSHLTLPSIDAGRRTLAGRELVPFAAGIAAGADCVMSAHVALRGCAVPASLDSGLIGGLLREGLGFAGAVITDALEMAGVLPDRLPMRSIDPRSRKAAGTGPAAVIGAALEAGNDLLLFSRPIAEVYGEIEDSSGELRDDLFRTGRYDALAGPSRARIAALCARNRVRIPAREKALADIPGGDFAHPAPAEREVARRSMRITGDPAGALGRAASGRPPRLVIAGPERDLAGPVVRRFAERLAGPLGAQAAFVTTAPGRAAGAPPAPAASAATVLVLVSRSPLEKGAVAARASAAQVVVAAGRPGDTVFASASTPTIATFGVYDAAADELARVLLGG